MMRLVLLLLLAPLATGARAALLPGLGEVSGRVAAPPGAIVPVYLYNAEKSVGFAVFAVNGRYRAVDLFPGHYDITVQNGYAPGPDSYEMAPVGVDVLAGGHARIDLTPRPVAATQNYTGREWYPPGTVSVQPYDTIYPDGPGRKILERTCIVCHGVNFIPGKAAARESWESFIHLMTKGPAEGGLFHSVGLVAGPPIIEPARLPAADVTVLLDYLVANFGPDSKPRAVLQDVWPPVDREALAKAMYVEYRFRNTPLMKRRISQELHFDAEGNVYVSDPGERAIMRVDPRTAETKAFMIPGGNSTHGITVDGDGTVWFSGAKNFLAHLDPKTGLFDQYPVTELGLHGNTPVFNSKGDLWFSMLVGNKLGHWDRAADRISYYESPMPDADPYGLVIDHHDNVWYNEYFTEALVRFDPRTQAFTRFPIRSSPASLRRLGVDSQDIVWYGVYGTMGKAGKLGRIDPRSGETTERLLPIEYSKPYDTTPDAADNIWISSENYLTKFDPRRERFTVYPLPERTDEPKIMVTRDGAVWYPPREAGVMGYGGSASVLYPDKDAIRTLGAYYWTNSSADHIARYRGAFTPVTGVVKWSKDGALNPDVPGEKTVGAPHPPGQDGQRPSGFVPQD